VLRIRGSRSEVVVDAIVHGYASDEFVHCAAPGCVVRESLASEPEATRGHSFWLFWAGAA
jgi:hypothetical protein